MSVYEGHGVTLHHADCLDVLRSLPDCSVDSVVTDPPYNLSFMAKPWDAYEGREDAGFAYWLSGLIDGEGHFAVKAHSRGTHAPYFQLKMRADERGTLDRIRRLLGVGVVSIESKEPNPMAKYVIQDKAGCQRLVDLLDKYPLRAKKQLDYWTWREAVCEWTSRPRGNRWHGAVDNAHMAELRSRLMENRAYTDVPWSGHEFQDWCRLWATECLRVLKPGGYLISAGGSRTYHRLACAVEDAGFEVRDSIAWLHGQGFPKSLDVSKAIDRAAGAEREVVGRYQPPNGKAWNLANDEARASIGPVGHSDRAASLDVTAPATDDARTWQGWGTALKPAFEPFVVARKPLASPGVNVLSVVESELRERGVEGAIQWTNGPVSGAARLDPPTSSSSTGAPPVGGTSADPAAASETPSDARPTDRSSATNTPHGETPTASTSATTPDARRANSETKSSTPTAAPAPAAANESATSSPSTTSTEGEVPTARPLGGRSTSRSSARDSLAATESFAGIATGLTGSWATVRIDRLADGTCVWPDGLPRNTAGGSTVAANVLEHGTGALNIDGCRVGDGGQLSWAEPRGIGYMGGGSNAGAVAATENAKGRWPANVVLDREMAEALDEQSGERPGFSTQRNAKESEPGSSWFGTRKGDTRAGEIREGYNDTGGASRFFFIAREDNPCHSTSSASTVESPSSHPRGPAASAPSDAATTACPDGERLTGSPSTSETPSASRPSVESGTTPTTSTVGASSPDWKPGEPSQMVSRARYAASLSRTATTTTTTSPSSSAGSVDPTTSSTTQASAPGVPLDELGSRFKYVAKADASERPRVNGTAHPTVKPLALMRWLVRLVTPPGGTVLEPFAGSGTTVEACIVEGFQCIAIEREADYLPLIRQRIDRRRDPVEALRGQAADLGLFDLLGGEGA